MNTATFKEFRRHIRQIEREVEYRLRDKTGYCGVTMPQYHVLVELEDMGTTNLVDLAKRLRLDTSTLSRTVDQLVRDGYLMRTVNPDDRRFITLILNEKGISKANEINNLCNEFYNEIFKGIPKGESGLLKSLKGFSEFLSQKCDWSCCSGKAGK